METIFYIAIALVAIVLYFGLVNFILKKIKTTSGINYIFWLIILFLTLSWLFSSNNNTNSSSNYDDDGGYNDNCINFFDDEDCD